MDCAQKLDQLAAEALAADTADAALVLEVLQTSRDFWGSDWTYEEQDAIGATFRTGFQAVVDEIIAVWGEPDYLGQPERSPFPNVSGGHEIAYWLRGGCLVGVFWDHQDKELPYTLELIACGPEALKQLARNESRFRD